MSQETLKETLAWDGHPRAPYDIESSQHNTSIFNNMAPLYLRKMFKKVSDVHIHDIGISTLALYTTRGVVNYYTKTFQHFCTKLSHTLPAQL